MLKKFIYLGYHISKTDWSQYWKFLKFTAKRGKKWHITLLLDSFWSSYHYKINLLEFFQFDFAHKTAEERKKWAGTAYMFEYHLAMNPKESRSMLSDKSLFLKEYAPFVQHKFFSIQELKEQPAKAQEILDAAPKVVLKSTDGQCGRGIVIKDSRDIHAHDLVAELESTGNDMAEEFVVQHPDLQRLSPSGLNTLRLITQINKDGDVDFLGGRLRITLNNSVDNLAAGNLAAEVDLTTGIIKRPAVYSDITKPAESVTHPITKTPIVGFQVPLFQESCEMVRQAALLHPQNRSIGWDVAITTNGPELIEANHDWCKLLWQLPVQTGLKETLEDYLHGRK